MFTVLAQADDKTNVHLICDDCRKEHFVNRSEFDIGLIGNSVNHKYIGKQPYECTCGNRMEQNSIVKAKYKKGKKEIASTVLGISVLGLLGGVGLGIITDIAIFNTIGVICIPFCLISFVIDKSYQSKEDQKFSEKMARWQSEYTEAKKQYNAEYKKIQAASYVNTNRSVCINSLDYYIWLENDALSLFQHTENLPDNLWDRRIGQSIQQTPKYIYYKDSTATMELPCKIIIPITVIEYYKREGEIYRETKISGGGGGGSSVGGAIVGGLLAGDAGAVIGSRKGTEPIKSETVTHDNRETVLSYFEDGQRKSLMLKYDDYQVLEDLIPEKNYNIVAEVKKREIVQRSIKSDELTAITEQIKEIAKLKDAGILSEEEFIGKKKELLERM